MERILIQQINEKIGKEIKIAGWVHTIRDQGSIKFILIRDITGIIQAVVTKDNAEAAKVVGSLSLESVVEIIGLVKNKRFCFD